MVRRMSTEIGHKSEREASGKPNEDSISRREWGINPELLLMGRKKQNWGPAIGFGNVGGIADFGKSGQNQ